MVKQKIQSRQNNFATTWIVLYINYPVLTDLLKDTTWPYCTRRYVSRLSGVSWDSTRLFCQIDMADYSR